MAVLAVALAAVVCHVASGMAGCHAGGCVGKQRDLRSGE